MMPTTDAMLIMEPPSCAPSGDLFFIIGRDTARVKRNVPFRLTFKTASQSSSLMRMRSPSLVMPALLTMTSILPKSAITAFTQASTSAETATFTP